MSTVQKCKNCGSLDIEADPARGDAVCTNCGSVLEENLIVSEVQFEESARGGSNVIGQFVPSDSKGGVSSFGSSFHIGVSVESREITLRKARAGISTLCNQLKLKQQHIDTALNFFKMALARNLTRGRRNTHMQAACVYITCRTEGTPHLLIDISDVLQICCYELGRTYLQVSQALCINIPSMDPCVFIMRFASKLEFGAKTNDVATTALRLVQRMKRDSIHSGRRPSGLCGAALLMAARLHDFNRTTSNIVKIVKIHESTLRKRLIEFSDTPSSALTLDEFLTVDLEEEQDPPSFKAARKKDKERLQKLMNDEEDTLIELKKEIEKELDLNSRKRKRTKKTVDNEEQLQQSQFIAQSTCETIQEILSEQNIDDPGFMEEPMNVELGPNLASMDLACSLDDEVNRPINTVVNVKEIDNTFDDIDDDELDAYILNEDEVEHKNSLWLQLNSDYLEQQKIKQEKLEKDKEEGKPEKKKRTNYRKKQSSGPSNTAGEAIKKMLQEKKVSSKINYDVLRSLTTRNEPSDGAKEAQPSNPIQTSTSVPDSPKKRSPTTPSGTNVERRTRVRPTINVKSKKALPLPINTNTKTDESDTEISKSNEDKPDHREIETEEELEDDFDDDFEEDPHQAVISDMFGNRNTYEEDDFEVEDY